MYYQLRLFNKKKLKKIKLKGQSKEAIGNNRKYVLGGINLTYRKAKKHQKIISSYKIGQTVVSHTHYKLQIQLSIIYIYN